MSKGDIWSVFHWTHVVNWLNTTKYSRIQSSWRKKVECIASLLRRAFFSSCLSRIKSCAGGFDFFWRRRRALGGVRVALEKLDQRIRVWTQYDVHCTLRPWVREGPKDGSDNWWNLFGCAKGKRIETSGQFEYWEKFERNDTFFGSQDPESDEDSCRSFVFVFWPRFIFWPFAFLRAWSPLRKPRPYVSSKRRRALTLSCCRSIWACSGQKNLERPHNQASNQAYQALWTFQF